MGILKKLFLSRTLLNLIKIVPIAEKSYNSVVKDNAFCSGHKS